MLGLIAAALLREGNYLYATATYEQARKILWGLRIDGKNFISQIPKELIRNIDNRDMKIEFINGSTLQMIGLQDIDTIVGIGADIIALSETTLLSEKVYTYLLPIIIFGRGMMCMDFTPRAGSWVHDLIQNPPDIDKILEDMLEKGLSEMEQLSITEEEYESLDHSIRAGMTKREYDEQKKMYKGFKFLETDFRTVKDTGLLTPLEQEITRQSYIAAEGTDATYRQEYELDWNAQNAKSIYGEVLEIARNEGRIAPWNYNPNFDLNVSLDLGIDDLTVLTFWQMVGSRMMILDVYSNRSKLDEHYVNYIINYKTEVKSIYLPHDSKDRNTETGRTRLDYYTNAMPNKKVVYVKKTESVQTDISRIRGSYFQAIYFNSAANGVKQLINNLENYDYRRDSAGISSGSLAHNDWADSFRYAVLNCFEDVSRHKLRNTRS